MSKTLAKVAVVVGAVALIATGVGAVAGAAGLTSVLGVATSTLMTVGAIAGVAASVISIGAQLTARKPSSAPSGSQTTFNADPDAGIPLALGRTGTAGNIAFRQGFDTADAGTNDRNAFVSVLSLGPVQAIEGQTVDRSPVSYASGAALGAFAGFMWSMTQIGALPEPAALGFGAGAGTPPGWSAAHKLSGKAAASWTLRFDTKAKMFQTGVPAPMWVVKGALAYDPRKDSTYPGGSGPHRMADPADRAAYDAAVATWEWTENPYLLGLRWAHGHWQRDTTDATSVWQRVMGMGSPIAAIDVAGFVEGANVADANSWTCGGVVYSTDDKWDVLKKILQAGMGEPLALGARIGCLVNAPKVSLATITTADLRGPVSVAATQPRRDRINTITPRYRLEANDWRTLPAAPISVAAYVTADRGKRSKIIDYWLIQNSAQAGVAVRYDIENAREFGPIVVPLGLAWMGYRPGDCVTATVPEMGLNGQPVLLLNRGLDPATGIVTLTGRSETAGKHPFALGQVATPPSTPALTGPPLIPVPAEGAWTLAAGTGGIPGLVVTGTVDAGTAEAVVFEYRAFVTGQAAGAGWRGAGVDPINVVKKEIGPLAGSTAYEVAVSYQARGVTGARRVLGPITTGAEVVGTQGPAGLNNATATIFKRSVATPALPSNPATWTFGTGISGLNNGWSATIPAGVDPLWASTALASAAGPTDSIAANEWAAPVIQARDGANGNNGTDGDDGLNGLNSQPLFIYQRAASTPNLPSAATGYTFSTKVLTGLNNGWQTNIPGGTDPIWISTATALSTTDTDTIGAGEWATAEILARNGADGDDGEDGVSSSTVDLAAYSLDFAANYDGSIKTGQQPRSVQASYRVGDIDQTGSTTWAIAAASNAAASVNAAGLVNITDVTGAGSLVVQGVFNGIARTRQLNWTRSKDAAPPAGATSLSQAVNGTQGSGTSYPAGVSTPVLTVQADGSGQLQAVLSLSYYADAASGGASTFHFFVIAGSARYRVAGSGAAWNDFSAGAVTGTTSSSTGYDIEPESEGTLDLNQVQTGLSAGVQYEIGVALRCSSRLRSSVAVFSGALTAKQP